MTNPEDKTPSPGQSAHNPKDERAAKDKAAPEGKVTPEDGGSVPPDSGSDPITVVGGSLTIYSPYLFEYSYDEKNKMHIYGLTDPTKHVKGMKIEDERGTMKFQDKPANGKFKLRLEYN